jgi:hypothetical protein
VRTDLRDRLRLAVAVPAAALALALALPAAANAAPVVLNRPADNAWGAVQVTLERSPKGVPTMLVMGVLSKTVRLPAEVALAVPTGQAVAWVGEVYPGGQSQDTKVTYRVERDATYDRVVFKMTKSRNAQVEVGAPSAIIKQESKELAKIVWAPFGGVGTVRLALNMPAGSKVETATPPGQTLPGDRGPVYATTSNGPVKTGASQSLTVLYTPGASGTATGGQQAGPAGTAGVPAPLLAVVVILVVVLGYLVISKRTASAGNEGEKPS